VNLLANGGVLLLLGGATADKPILPTFVSSDKLGNIYTFSSATKELLCYTKDMKLKFRTGGIGSGDSILQDPTELVVLKDQLIVADTASLAIFDTKGKFLRRVKEADSFKFIKPTGLSIDPAGRLVVCDVEANQVAVLESDFSLKKIYSDFSGPTAFYETRNSNYVCLEKNTGKVTTFSSYMARIKVFPGIKNARSMIYDGNSLLYILDEDSVKVFTMDGRLKSELSIIPKRPEGTYPAIALIENSVCFASHADSQILKIAEGSKLTTLIDKDSSALFLPEGMTVDENGKIFIADTGNNLIRVLDQKGGNLFSFEVDKPKKLTVMGDSLAIVRPSSIDVYSRSGKKLYSISFKDALDCDFAPDGSLLVLSFVGTVTNFVGTKDMGLVFTEKIPNPISISSCQTHFGVATKGSKIEIFKHNGSKDNTIELETTISDIIMLSPQRIIVLGKDGFKLVEQNSKVMKSFGKSTGIRVSHEPTSDPISFSSNLDSFSAPSAVSRFGDWIYSVDFVAMRAVRFPKELLLAPPKIKISPETLDFGVVLSDQSTSTELVIENIGGETIEGIFTQIPKWITLDKKILKGDDSIIKVIAKTTHFLSNVTYLENLTLETNIGTIEIPCRLQTPNQLPKQINIELKVGSKSVKVGSKTIDVGASIYMEGNALMVPIKFISECFGSTVSQEGNFIDVVFASKKITVSFEVGSQEVAVEINGESKFMRATPPPKTISKTTFVPLKFFVELLDCEEYWDSSTKQMRLVYTP
jgi:sugar lactone lactonase YvrE